MKLKYRILLFLLALGTASPAWSQAGCIGSSCSVIPLNQDTLNNMYFQFQYQYTNELFSEIARAGTMANISGPPIGTVNLQKFTIGADVGAGYVPITKKNIVLNGVGTFQDVPSGGAYVMPRIFAGINLGYLLGSPYDPTSGDRTPSMLSPARLDIYLQGVDARRSSHFDNGNGKASSGFYNRGIDVRYHLVEGGESLGGPLLRFLGVSLGWGYHVSRFDIHAEQFQRYKVATFTGGQVFWDGYNYLYFDGRIKSTSMELATGLQLLYFLNLTIGGGVSRNSGNADFSLGRLGPIYAITDLNSAALSASNVNFLSNTFNSYLYLNISGKGKVPRYLPYGKVGVDINILALKIFVEGLSGRHVFGANAGVRVQF
ncbi:MAG: hypothetical protein K8S54_17900 [Spirochaetia bacterium]|nr:hypothetical protein [Spirochaetia bacterium]